MDTRDRAWQQLRGMRSRPPGLASDGARRLLFSAALEQSEQLLRGAEGLGAATRPLNLFYGLSQGARALAAARMRDNEGRLSGHGIRLHGSLDRDLVDIELEDHRGPWGSFTTVAGLLGSPSLTSAVKLGDLLAALPLTLPSSSWSSRPTTLVIEHVRQNSGAYLVNTPKIYAGSGPWPDVPELRHGSAESRRSWASEYLNRYYPDLRGAQPMPDGHFRVDQYDRGLRVVLLIEVPNSIGSDEVRAQALYQRTMSVAGGQLVPPLVGDLQRSLHPLVDLWACLWALSMLARYQPVRWSQLVNVDMSNDATALEELLEDALDLVPALLVEALE